MSNWTHVAGIIRVDGLVEMDFDEVIGKECLWESPEEVWDDAMENPDKYLPMGSEGSLHKSIWINPDGNCLPRYTISIFGDLRDHDSASEIIEWFKKKCELLWVRNAVITVSNCYYGTKVWSYIEPEERVWTPCSEKLPVVPANRWDNFLVTEKVHTLKGDVIEVDTESFFNGKFQSNTEVIAWMPLPKPYKESEEQDEKL